jgi:hypothetical protein
MRQLAALEVPVSREGHDALAVWFPEASAGGPPQQARIELDFVLRVLTRDRETTFELEELRE